MIRVLDRLAYRLTERAAQVEHGLTAVIDVNLTLVISLGFDPKSHISRERLIASITDNVVNMIEQAGAANVVTDFIDDVKLIETRDES